MVRFSPIFVLQKEEDFAYMKITIYIFFFLLILTNNLRAQSAANILAAESCQCIGQVQSEVIEDIEQLTNSCIQESILRNLDWLKQKYNWNSSTTEAEKLGQQIGQEVGEILIKECTALMAFLKSEAPMEDSPLYETSSRTISGFQDDLPFIPENPSLPDEQPSTNISEGILLALQGNDMAYFMIVDEYGDRLSFGWLTPFEGDEYFHYGIGVHEGRRVRIYWDSLELYQLNSRRYQKVKVVGKIEFVD